MKLTLIQGGKQNQKVSIFHKLKHGAAMVRQNNRIPTIQRNLLAAILEGNQTEVDKLFAISDRMKKSKISET